VRTAAVEDYLKAIYKLQSRSGSATNAAVAEELGVKPASVTGMVGKLVQKGLAQHAPYHGVRLTPDGERLALVVIRHHRLIELALSEFLDYPLDQVHAEADRLEHAVSPELAERLARKLGDPSVDPHGDPIPTRDGAIVVPRHERLSDVEPGTAVVVRRVSDADPDRLRYLGNLGLVPNAEARVVSSEPFGGPLVVEVSGVERAIGRDLAGTIRVSRA
jgi:DtxR family transcriptional regulator, Mn-dependent transcriptional regulator